MKKKNAWIQFGEEAEGYAIPVLNEREIRAAAGILFLATFTSLLFIVFRNNFLPVKYVITFFLVDFLIRVFVNPRYSPTLIMGRLAVRGQHPEFVGARQKKFAWTIGLIISGIMFIFLVLVNAYSPITGIGCLLCLIFLFFESAFGICLGCKFYPLFFKAKVQYCPGEICDRQSRQPIQKISVVQGLILLLFIAAISVSAFTLQKEFVKKPYDLFGISNGPKKATP